MLLIGSCSSKEAGGSFSVKLSSGETVSYFIDVEEIGGQKILVVDHLSIKTALSESRVEQEVHEIWKSASAEADKKSIDEALIKYRYPVSAESSDQDEKNYRGLLFEAEKLENGTWKLRKVN